MHWVISRIQWRVYIAVYIEALGGHVLGWHAGQKMIWGYLNGVLGPFLEKGGTICRQLVGAGPRIEEQGRMSGLRHHWLMMTKELKLFELINSGVKEKETIQYNGSVWFNQPRWNSSQSLHGIPVFTWQWLNRTSHRGTRPSHREYPPSPSNWEFPSLPSHREIP